MKTPLLFPAIGAEALVIYYLPADQVRVMIDFHEKGIDKAAFFVLAIMNLFKMAKEHGLDSKTVLLTVLREMGANVE